jgi:hypothetical protein
MPTYDRSFDPPAPVAQVTLRNPNTRASQTNVLMYHLNILGQKISEV